jgi:hypothetical protein
MYPAQAQDNTPDTLDNKYPELEEGVEESITYLQQTFNFGFKAGLNFSTFNDAEKFNADTQTQLHIGFFPRYRLSSRISTKVELLYSSKGARADEFSIFEDYSVDLGYITIPVMGEFAITDRLAVEVGPYVGFLISARQSFNGLENRPQGIDVSEDETNPVDIGLGGGIVYTGTNGLGVGVRYSQGLADALGDDFLRSASGANAVFQVSGYYHF